MYIRKRIGKKRTFFKKYRALAIFLLFGGVCLFGIVVANRVMNTVDARLPIGPVPENLTELEREYQSAKHERTVYPYSIIPGGVRSREELTAQISSDPVVAEHFAEFNTSQARMIRAAETRFMYVSYRLRNKVYWTKKKLQIPQGEALISDGNCEARARCGNRVSAAPMEPVSEEEPVIETFEFPPQLARLEQPKLGPISDPSLELLAAPPIPSIDSPVSTLRPAILPYYYRPLFVVRPSGSPVPETSTLVMVITGLAAFAVTRFRRKK